MFSALVAPPINDKIFEDIASEEGKFCRFIAGEFNDEVGRGCLKCKFSAELFHDAYQSYKWDIERLSKNMETPPDHYKLSGFLSYWLRRSSPVIGWDNQGRNDFDLTRDQKKVREFIFDYGRTYLTFSLGYKNISPHSLRVIYKSLFFV